MADLPDPEFYTRSTAVIDLCNSQLTNVPEDRVAASAAYAAARFSVWATANKALTSKELEGVRQQALDTFTAGYRQMLEYHFDDYVKNYNTYYAAVPRTVIR